MKRQRAKRPGAAACPRAPPPPPLTGDGLFVVLHEAREAEVGAVLRVGHLLQAGERGVGLHAVQLAEAAGQPADGRAAAVHHAAAAAAALDRSVLVCSISLVGIISVKLAVGIIEHFEEPL